MANPDPLLTAEELAQFQDAVSYRYGAGEPPQELPPNVAAYVHQPDGGLIKLLDLATELRRQLDAAGPREITNSDGLEALPHLAIVISQQSTGWQMTDRNFGGDAIWESGTTHASSAQLLAAGPVTVVWEPSDG